MRFFLLKLFIVLLFHFTILYPIVAQDDNKKLTTEDYMDIENDISYYHNKISKVILFYKNKIKDGKLSIDISLGKHRYSVDPGSKYTYRNKAFFYFDGLKLVSIAVVYQKVDEIRLFTENRRLINKQLEAKALDSIEMVFAEWTVDQEESNRVSKVNSFADVFDSDLYPAGSKIERFKLNNLSKSQDKSKILLNYRDNLRSVLRNLEYQIQVINKGTSDDIQKSVQLGVKD